jgi:nitroreductase/NAD-dependent dihydropyrimidine dehydrogenase PreA subunit
MFDDLKQAYLPRTRFPTRTLDREKCEKCLRCSDACPTYGFRVDEDGFPVPQGYGGMEEACLNCWNCVVVCPTRAITVEGAYFVPEGRYRSLVSGTPTYPDPLGRGEAGSWEEVEKELSEVERVIYKRRSIRLFKDKPVPREMLARVVEAGRFAPSSGNCQPWKFIVITDREIIREIERQAMKILRPMKNLYYDEKGKRRFWKNLLFTLTSLFMRNKMDPRPFTAMEKADRCDEVIYWNAPAVIVIAKDARGISNPDLDGGIAAQNMVLAAHSLGLGSCYIGLAVEPMNYPHMKKIRKKLGIVSPWEPLTSIALGYPKGRIDNIVQRDNPPVEWFE